MKCLNCGHDNPADSGFCGKCGSAIKLPEDDGDFNTIGNRGTFYAGDTQKREDDKIAELEAGTEFAGRYVISSTIGRGGMGVVYAAHDNITDEDVALKLIRRDRLSGPEAVKRLIREGVTTRDIRHPNVVSVYDVGDADGQPYLSMELLTGQSLRQWINEKARAREDISYAVAARIVREILEGLKAAHAKGVIHRDLKPENIILLRRPEDDSAPLRIADFGIAQAMGRQFETGATGALGTRGYMAPEQETNPDTATESADFYSLSRMFYELLVGVLPGGHWQPPSGGREDVPPQIDGLIERGLADRAMMRPQSVDEYLDAINAAGTIGGDKPNPPPPPPPPEPDDKEGGTKKGFPIITIAAVVVFGVIGLSFMGDDEPPITPDPPLNPGGNDGGDTDFDKARREAEERQRKLEEELRRQAEAENPFEYFIGTWYEPAGNSIVEWDVDVTSNGVVSGDGELPGFISGTLDGRFNGNFFQFTVQSTMGTFSYTGSFDGGCHINVPQVTQFHINHFPGGPCP